MERIFDLQNDGSFYRRNNRTVVSGILEKDFTNDFGYRYASRIIVEATANRKEYRVPVIITSNLFRENFVEGKYVEVAGEIRTYNVWTDGKSHLKIYVWAKRIHVCDSIQDLEEPLSQSITYLDGFVCKQPIYRKTLRGREITEIFLAVNLNNKRSAYIPTITWGKLARYARHLEIGEKIAILGRMQNREYFKRISPDSAEGEIKEAYEVSIAQILN